MTTSETIYLEAMKYLGISETPGPKSTPEIARMFSIAPSWLDQDDSVTAWCGIFRGWVGYKTATGMPANHFRAASWLDWGKEIKLADVAKGDTLVFKRSGGYHVALFSFRDGDFLHHLGGNQSNAVTIAPSPISKLVGIRRG